MIDESLERGQQDAAGDFAFLIEEIKRAKYWLLLCIVLSLALATAYLKYATYTYMAEIKVVPAQSSGGQMDTTFGGLASVAGVSLSSGDKVAPLDLYMEQLHSRIVAVRLSTRGDLIRHIFAAEWDTKRHIWRQPTSSIREASHFIKNVLGIPVSEWRPPDAARLQNYVMSTVSISQQTDKPIATIRFNDADPRFAVAFLTALHQTTDNIIRQSALQKSTEYIAYLKATIPTVTVIEQRIALSSLLSEQEKTRMLASSSAPYAADMIDIPYASTAPTKPRPLLVLLGSVMIGLTLALAAVLVRMQFRNAK